MLAYSQLEKETWISSAYLLVALITALHAVLPESLLFPVMIPPGPSQPCSLLVNKILGSMYVLQTVPLKQHKIVTVLFYYRESLCSLEG